MMRRIIVASAMPRRMFKRYPVLKAKKHTTQAITSMSAVIKSILFMASFFCEL
jgi:hypothetical protein